MTAPIVSNDHRRDPLAFLPTSPLAFRSHFDARAGRALRGTAAGESMATWGERYLREARAVLAVEQRPGTLWDRVAEGRGK